MSSDLLKITILQLPTVLQPRTRDSIDASHGLHGHIITERSCRNADPKLDPAGIGDTAGHRDKLQIGHGRVYKTKETRGSQSTKLNTY